MELPWTRQSSAFSSPNFLVIRSTLTGRRLGCRKKNCLLCPIIPFLTTPLSSVIMCLVLASTGLVLVLTLRQW